MSVSVVLSFDRVTSNKNRGPSVNPKTLTIGGLVCLLAVLAGAVGVGGIYDLSVSDVGVAYRINRFTGTVWYCVGTHCEQGVEKR